MNKDFERCCSFLADMIIKYAPRIRDEVEMCMIIKDSIDDEKVNRQKQFDRFCYYWIYNKKVDKYDKIEDRKRRNKKCLQKIRNTPRNISKQ